MIVRLYDCSVFFYRMKFHILCLAVWAFLAATYAEEAEPEAARLLVSKKILNKYLVENMDIIVKVFYLYLCVIYTRFVFILDCLHDMDQNCNHSLLLNSL